MGGIARGAGYFVFAVLVHWWWSTHGALGGLAPQVLLVLTVAAAARYGPVRAMVLAFAWGLALDVLSPRLFGANALALTLVAYGTGSVRRQVDVTGLAPQLVVVAGMTWAFFLLHGLLGLLFAKTFFWVGWFTFLLSPLYNGFVAALALLLWPRERAERRA